MGKKLKSCNNKYFSIELFSTQMSECILAHKSLVQGLVTYVIVLYVYLGLDYEILPSFFFQIDSYMLSKYLIA